MQSGPWQYVPCFVLVGGCAFLFWVVAFGARRALRQLTVPEPPRCRRCGYDLRASTDWCPECGLPIGAARRLTLRDIDLDRIKANWPTERLAKRNPGMHESLIDLLETVDGEAIETLYFFLSYHGFPCSLFADQRASELYHTLRLWSDDVDSVIALLSRFDRRTSLELSEEQVAGRDDG